MADEPSPSPAEREERKSPRPSGEISQSGEGEGEEEGEGDEDSGGEAIEERYVALDDVEDGGEKEAEYKEEEDKGPPLIPDNFYYNLEELQTKPAISEDCNLPENLLTLYHSFGYNCHMRHNLHAIDDNTLVFSAGAYLQFVDLHTLHYSYVRSTGGGSTGAICVHPQGRLFAVGEKGHNPPINIFVITNLRLYRICRGGTTRSYASLAFNASGELLASQGGDPDYQLTVWDWAQERILLRCKAFSQEVYSVSFNKDLQGWLTTAGSGHIKFWAMARTFTGLKLHGCVGRFGRTALSDIEGLVEFPDGKVLSGSEWGNLLLWDENLIKLQVARKDGKPCHIGQVQHMLMVEGEVLTAGLDGFVRCWNWEAIDQSETGEEGGQIELRPMSEVFIGQHVQLYYLTKPPKVIRFENDEGLHEVEQLPPEVQSDWRKASESSEIPRPSRSLDTPADKDVKADNKDVKADNMDVKADDSGERDESGEKDDSSKHMWYCQDGNGAIWKADLSFLSAAKAPKDLLHFHSGKIVALAVSPVTHLAMTLGEDGRIRLYDFLQKKPLASMQFKAAGHCMVWVPLSADKKCSSILAGFSDGGIRVVSIDGYTQTQFGVDKMCCTLKLIRALKPHDKPVTGVAYDSIGEHLVTCSEDKTVFFFYVSPKTYYPMCFMELQYVPRSVKYSQDTMAPENVLVTCQDGMVIEMGGPAAYERKYIFEKHIHKESLKYDGIRIREFHFKSCKSRLRHDEEMESIRLMEEEKQKKIEEEDARLVTEGLETPSAQNLRHEQERLMSKVMKAKEEEEEKKKPKWQPYIPPNPCQILQALYLEPNSRIWLSMSDFDAGYLYECELPRYFSHVEGYDGPLTSVTRAIPVKDSEDVAVAVIRFNSDGTCVFFGMQNGSIRLQFLETEFDLASPSFYWSIPAHDVTHGAITGMELSHDEAFLLTVGEDGNFFVFSLLPIHQLMEQIKERKAKIPIGDPDIPPGVDLEAGQYTIEQAKQKTDHDLLVKEAEKAKSEKRILIAQLRTKFRHLWNDNNKMPARQRLTKAEFLMDEGRLIEMKQEAEDKLAELRKQKAWDSEKARLSYQKLHDCYRKYLTQDRFAVKALLSDHVIYSYRTQEEPEIEDYDGDNEGEPEMRKSRMSDVASREHSIIEEFEPHALESCEDVSQRTKYLLRQATLKRKKRAYRRRQWRRFMETKPDDDYADPADIQAIDHAYATIGDFKLKVSPEYMVPDSYKLTLRDSKKRLKTCEQYLLSLQTGFNQRLLALRDEKAELIQDINGMIGRLKSISDKLSMDYFRPVPATLRLEQIEMPEDHFKIDKSDLLTLKRRLEEDQRRRSVGSGVLKHLPHPSPPQTQRGGRISMVMTHPKTSRNSVVRMSVPPVRLSEPITSHEPTLGEESIETAGEPDESGVKLSALSIEIEQIKTIERVYEQDQIYKTILRKKQLFDVQHRLLRHEKFVLDGLTKMGDLRTTTLTEEKLLMKECESVEAEIRERIANCMETKVNMDKELKYLVDNIDKRTKDLERCVKKEKTLLEQVHTIIGEKNHFRDYLVKVYKKKIRRKVKAETEDDDEEDDSSSESSDDEDNEEGEDSGEDVAELVYYDLNSCPDGCDPDKYNEIVLLRETRVEMDEQVADLKRTRDNFLKDMDGAKKKKLAADVALEKANKELAAFQTEKQKKVNDLDVLTVLQLHQLQCLKRHEMPPDVQALLNINEADVLRLQARIRELKNEMKVQKKRMLESRKLHAHLQYERGRFLNLLAEMSEACDEAMRKKFGKVCDLEILESVICDPDVEEVKIKLMKTRRECDEEMRKINQEYTKLTDDKTDLMLRLDSEIRNIKAALWEERLTLTRNLNHMVSRMRLRVEEDVYKLPKDMEELISVIAQQRVALQALSREIHYLTSGPKPVVKHTGI